MKIRTALIAGSAVLALLVLPGCGGRNVGVIQGFILLSSESSPLSGERGIPGTVTVSRDGKDLDHKTLVLRGRYTFKLSPGKYHLTAKTAQAGTSCVAEDINLDGGETREVIMHCYTK
ncbi:hypothetical protein Daura_22640 [Dactylosporangium aurantiacum]|uniref:Carboxypeptidase regulatory-like domain-containing protein n=1 Tax=Dactylosporangium aurantiacum TaxID=35754 RepID=A0A9Q9IRZ9_9ACTN|nr:hypothetical protein [Dactylosporangium aurantiacum]MDG6107692.1 hypothetical protein [Dactylosporangium aurantiacum]UWZ58717.1 hypothetical protein Daura_22640 [Dactylosporangium aurantiacum]